MGPVRQNPILSLCENGMALNASKSVVILFGTSLRLKSLSGLKSVSVTGTVIPVSDEVKILGATLDSNLTMEPGTKTIPFCFYNILSLKQIHSFSDDSMASSVHLRLFHPVSIVNSILYGRNCTSLKNINRLRRIRYSLFWLEL